MLDFFDASETFEYLPTDGSTLTSIFFLLEGPAIKPGIVSCDGDVFATDNFCVPVVENPDFASLHPGSTEIFATDVNIFAGEMGTIIVSPEPGTLLMLGLGLAALVGFRRKFEALAK